MKVKNRQKDHVETQAPLSGFMHTVSQIKCGYESPSPLHPLFVSSKYGHSAPTPQQLQVDIQQHGCPWGAQMDKWAPGHMEAFVDQSAHSANELEGYLHSPRVFQILSHTELSHQQIALCVW